MVFRFIWIPLIVMGVSVSPLPGKAADLTSIVPNSKLGKFRHGTLVQSKKTLLGRKKIIVAPSPSAATHTHPGVDIVAKCGSSIYSAADGYVVDVIDNNKDRDFKFLGYMALVKHAAGIGGKDAYSLYLHMEAKPRVAIVQDVKSGKTLLGKVGKTGVATACHTHLEVRHFATRYLYDTGWNRPWNIYGKGDQRNAERFRNSWTDPVAFISKPSETKVHRPLLRTIEFDGGYVETQTGGYMDMQTKKFYRINIGDRHKRYLHRPPIVNFVIDKTGMVSLSAAEFKGIVIKGQHQFRAFSLHPLEERRLKESEYPSNKPNDPKGDEIILHIKERKPYYVPGKRLEIRRKSVGTDFYYFQPSQALKVGQYVAWIGKKFWLFEIK